MGREGGRTEEDVERGMDGMEKKVETNPGSWMNGNMNIYSTQELGLSQPCYPEPEMSEF